MEEQAQTSAPPKPPAPPRGPAILRPLEYVIGPWTRQNAMVWLKLIALVLVLKWIAIEPFRVPSGSMEPTLYGNMNYATDDRVVVNKLAYGVRLPFSNRLLFRTGEPERWDIAVFRSVEPPPENADALERFLHRVWPKALIKRIVGLPGERIHIENGRICANGRALELPPDMPDVHYTTIAPGDPLRQIVNGDSGELSMVGTQWRYGIWQEDAYAVVPPDSYLVLGDNSGLSVDGRSFGWVPRGHLLGRAFGIWWPLGRARDLTGFSETWWGLLLLAGIPLAFVLYETITAFFARSWRVREDAPAYGLRRGDRLFVNCAAFGLRVPFTRRRLGKRRDPVPGGLVVYLAPSDSDWAGAPLLGRVVTCETQSGAGCYIESVEGADYPDSRHFGPVGHGNLVGRVESVWWPLRRRGRVTAGGEGQTEPNYGQED